MKTYEYAVAAKEDKLKDGSFSELHRTNMTKKEAEEWVRTTNSELISGDYFVVVKREVSPWFQG